MQFRTARHQRIADPGEHVGDMMLKVQNRQKLRPILSTKTDMVETGELRLCLFALMLLELDVSGPILRTGNLQITEG